MPERNNESIKLVKCKVKVLELSHLVAVLPVKTQYFTLGFRNILMIRTFFL